MANSRAWVSKVFNFDLIDFFWKYMDEETYRQTKQELTQEILKRILKQFPELEGKIELLDSWTPRTYERYCNAYHGAYMSFITTKEAKQLRIKGELKNLKHFYLAGQWIMCPGGLPIAAVSGKNLVKGLIAGCLGLVLSFVGVGIALPECSVGTLIEDGFNNITTLP